MKHQLPNAARYSKELSRQAGNHSQLNLKLLSLIFLMLILLAAQFLHAQDCTGFRTQTQGGWGADPDGNNPGVYLHDNFAAAFPGGLTIGCNGSTLLLTDAQAVTDFLPSTTTPSVLPAGAMVNPGSSYLNVFAGQLETATLNVGFDSYDPDFSSNSLLLGDLIIASGPFAGWTVSQLLTEANNAIGGCSSTYSLSDLNDALDAINNNYDNGTSNNGYLNCPCTIQASATTINATCHGSENGSIDVTVTEAHGEVTYLWNDGVITEDRSNLPAGTYSLTVTDNNGCSATVTKIITEPDELGMNATVNNVLCNSNATGSIDVTVFGGTPPYSYLWNDGSTTEDRSNLTAGSYTLTVTDNNGCAASSTQTITEPDVLGVSGVITSVSSANVSDGAIDITVTGGTLPYAYLWSNGATTEDLTGIPVGSYTVTVTDHNGCPAIQSFEVTDPGCTGFRTQTQGGWGAIPNGNNPGVYLHANFAAAFPGGLTIGCAGSTLLLTDAQAVTDFLPSTTAPALLPAGAMVNPGSSYHNVLAGQLETAALNVGFDSYDPNFGSNSQLLGDLFIVSGTFAGWTVSQLIAEANNAIGGCSNLYSLSDLNNTLDSINQNYDNGTVDNHFLNCQPCVCAPPSNLTVDSVSAAEALLCWEGNSCAHAYIVAWRNQNSSVWLYRTVSAPEHCMIFTNRYPAVFEVQIASICLDGDTSAYGETFVFPTFASCLAPQNPHTNGITSSKATLNWSTVIDASKYVIWYRQTGVPVWTKKTISAAKISLIIKSLLASTAYEWKVQSKCIGTSRSVVGTFTALQHFTTLSAKMNENLTESVIGNINVYPNPAVSQFTFEFEANGSGTFSIAIENVLGQMVYSTQPESYNGSVNKQVDISNLKGGIYILHLYIGGNEFSKRLIIQSTD
ncbi:MAG TPA: T9SS type A sorting domain-containing protein [Chitinophagales bacterium]|nr:T9SS type A sorting domain-containing protein [Chitinophagales bacterium]